MARRIDYTPQNDAERESLDLYWTRIAIIEKELHAIHEAQFKSENKRQWDIHKARVRKMRKDAGK